MNVKEVKVIAICANDTDTESNVASRFARCEYYTVYNHETLEFTFYKNIAKDEMSGAGGKAAKQISDLNVDVVLVPEVGPKAYDALEAFEIDIYRYTKSYSVRDAVYEFYENNLERVTSFTKKGKH
ncbi:NifB/NifX family molybdenum-iron cluster-binding protein [Candidatus Izimaplasma sp. HR1]|jgi:predicted Fe-Mo cluster-binding NifX family protein|uniref:NifB/NifX family molybdenum-iron cluster-binding protein n=1 Tax=Candidatus Izimoplasma sp. HR1 TaxID=1541959 RepID=UPI0006990903